MRGPATVLSVAIALAAAAPARSAPCDRACLIGVVDKYLAAVSAHDPRQAPLADHVLFVENLEKLPIGDGLWKTATAGPTTFKIYVPDPITEQVGFLGMIEETTPTYLGLRLKVKDGKIVEAEHLLARNINGDNLKNLQVPRSGLTTEVPAAERASRDELARIGATYYDALDENDGTLAPFAKDCVRFENGGMASTNPERLEIPVNSLDGIGRFGCTEQLSTGVFAYIDTIDDRRVFAADPVTGLAIGFSHFHHGMAKKYVEVKLPGFPDIDHIDLNFGPFDLPAAHVWKISGGKIHEIEAMGFAAPYNAPTGREE
jgi:hypothetical protein